jgi:C-1 hydroxylase
MRFEIDDMVAEGDKIVTRMTWRATHRDSYMCSRPTDREISCTVIGIARVTNGKIAEHWGVTDELYLMQQIGLVPDEVLAAMA